jgi:hypothetical protein
MEKRAKLNTGPLDWHWNPRLTFSSPFDKGGWKPMSG